MWWKTCHTSPAQHCGYFRRAILQNSGQWNNPSAAFDGVESMPFEDPSTTLRNTQRVCWRNTKKRCYWSQTFSAYSFGHMGWNTCSDRIRCYRLMKWEESVWAPLEGVRWLIIRENIQHKWTSVPENVHMLRSVETSRDHNSQHARGSSLSSFFLDYLWRPLSHKTKNNFANTETVRASDRLLPHCNSS